MLYLLSLYRKYILYILSIFFSKVACRAFAIARSRYKHISEAFQNSRGSPRPRPPPRQPPRVLRDAWRAPPPGKQPSGNQ
ncbi:hypothetical protein E2C01_083837 [Portunus trituberculatus]|uniref:Uncharacterized protein n=1 Tax=Portunus trituberculatus TaxID=210409 RepID=A0A5B7J395_PORTR|nr:hypothetical protein [Portunus trituberculatus]